MDVQNKTLVCKDCKEDFIWTVGEQNFYSSKGLKNKPTRCKECRKKNRQKVETDYFKVYCFTCGQIGETLTQPSDSKAKVYCQNCFKNNLSSNQ